MKRKVLLVFAVALSICCVDAYAQSNDSGTMEKPTGTKVKKPKIRLVGVDAFFFSSNSTIGYSSHTPSPNYYDIPKSNITAFYERSWGAFRLKAEMGRFGVAHAQDSTILYSEGEFMFLIKVGFNSKLSYISDRLNVGVYLGMGMMGSSIETTYDLRVSYYLTNKTAVNATVRLCQDSKDGKRSRYKDDKLPLNIAFGIGLSYQL